MAHRTLILATAAAVLAGMAQVSAREAAPKVPTALVEDVKSTTAGVEFMDYVGSGQIIKLGPHDTLVLSYLQSCEQETITGGTVIVGAARSAVQGGQVARSKSPCDGGNIRLSAAEASKSAASAFRVQSAGTEITLYAQAPAVQFPKDAPRRGSHARDPSGSIAPANATRSSSMTRVRRQASTISARPTSVWPAAVSTWRASAARACRSASTPTPNPARRRSRAACCASNSGVRPGRPWIRSPARGSSRRSDCALRGSRRRLAGASTDCAAGRSTSSPCCAGASSATCIRRQSSPAVVVALDEETFRTPPFAGSPSVTWTPEIGRVLSAIIDGGAKVVGFDIVFPTSIEQSAVPFGDETLGSRLHGFDRDYLRALALGARDGKVVLGEVQNQDSPVLPSPGQRAAVGFGRNIRPLNVYSDPDGVIRRVPLTFTVDGEPVPSMAAELAARASGAPPSREARQGRRRRRTRSRSTSRPAPTTSRPFRSPISAPAPRRATRTSSAAISTARSCCSARCSTSRTARSPPRALPRARRRRARSAAR